jgi:hypothetical protein
MTQRFLNHCAWAGMAIVCLLSAVQSGRLAVSQAASLQRDPDFGIRPSGGIPQHLEKAAILEMNGKVEQAEKELLSAAEQDRRFGPAWALAQFYDRQHRSVECRIWLQRAAEMSYGDKTALLQLMAREFGSAYPADFPARLRSEYEACLRPAAN